MAKLHRVTNQKGTYLFYCKGFETAHEVWDKTSDANAKWDFNNDFEKPTFSPSLLIHYTKCSYNEDGSVIINSGVPMVCHSYITNGNIKYLGDCTHSLAGKTIELPDF